MNTLWGWALVFHVLGIVLWMGSLMTSTQLMATLAETSSPDSRATLIRLIGKLVNGVGHPGAIITILSGAVVLSENPQYYLHATWMHAKLFLVAILIGIDIATYIFFRGVRAGEKSLGRGALKALHGLTTLVFLGVLIMVIIKPFGP